MTSTKRCSMTQRLRSSQQAMGEDLEVVVLDDTERTKTYDSRFPKGANLHLRKLKFLTDHRPAMRYLYFSFAMNVLRQQRHEVDGWWKDRLTYHDLGFFCVAGEMGPRDLFTQACNSDRPSDYDRGRSFRWWDFR
ncbi:hypothetical protein F4808DRAFT_444248 [Astrocystis sublimbata]|nr:hypothetical protein F4808DRAFT_444248 [Astrocystis sublimbata]